MISEAESSSLAISNKTTDRDASGIEGGKKKRLNAGLPPRMSESGRTSRNRACGSVLARADHGMLLLIRCISRSTATAELNRLISPSSAKRVRFNTRLYKFLSFFQFFYYVSNRNRLGKTNFAKAQRARFLIIHYELKGDIDII